MKGRLTVACLALATFGAPIYGVDAAARPVSETNWNIEAAQLADFVVLEKSPLEKIENSVSVELVVKNGRAYTPDELAR